MVSQGKAGNSTLKKEKKNTLCVVLLSCWPVFIFVFSRYIWVSFRFRFFFQFSVDVSAGHRRTNGARNVSTSKLSRQFLLSCPHVQHDPLFLFFLLLVPQNLRNWNDLLMNLISNCSDPQCGQQSSSGRIAE